jgi:hypothetical protein
MMRNWVFFLLLCRGFLHAANAEFDVAVVGTSPVSLLEAIYHIRCGEKVLIIEADERLGGAWKSIDICGVEHVDLGCHLIGSNPSLKAFLETQFGCRFVCLEHPTEMAISPHERCPIGYYFSRGCHELISQLLQTISQSHNALIVQKKLESVSIAQDRQSLELKMEGFETSAAKLFVTYASQFKVEQLSETELWYTHHDFYHLYLLIQEEGPARFTYLNSIANGMQRAMNLTPFVSMPQPNTHLIVIQTYGRENLGEMQSFMEAFKANGYLSQQAQILTSDVYYYRQASCNLSYFQKYAGPLVEVLDSSSFAGISRYLDKWLGK